MKIIKFHAISYKLIASNKKRKYSEIHSNEYAFELVPYSDWNILETRLSLRCHDPDKSHEILNEIDEKFQTIIIYTTRVEKMNEEIKSEKYNKYTIEVFNKL